MSPGPWIFSFLKGWSISVLGRRVRKLAKRKQQEVGQHRPQQSNVWSLVMVPEKLLLLECAWLGLPWVAESMFELLGPAMRPRWVAPRNTNLSLCPTWDMRQEAIGACSCPPWATYSPWAIAASHQGCLQPPGEPELG